MQCGRVKRIKGVAQDGNEEGGGNFIHCGLFFFFLVRRTIGLLSSTLLVPPFRITLKKRMVQQDPIYVRPVTLDDLKYNEQVYAVINDAYRSGGIKKWNVLHSAQKVYS